MRARSHEFHTAAYPSSERRCTPAVRGVVQLATVMPGFLWWHFVLFIHEMFWFRDKQNEILIEERLGLEFTIQGECCWKAEWRTSLLGFYNHLRWQRRQQWNTCLAQASLHKTFIFPYLHTHFSVPKCQQRIRIHHQNKMKPLLY